MELNQIFSNRNENISCDNISVFRWSKMFEIIRRDIDIDVYHSPSDSLFVPLLMCTRTLLVVKRN